jgi:phosphatidate cytidylyltransferase
MLKTRILTALVILPIVFIALFTFPNWAWDVFTGGIVLVACWEWSRFCQFPAGGKRAYLLLTALVGAAIFFAYLDGNVLGVSFDSFKLVGFVLAALFWFVVAPWWLVKQWRPKPFVVAALTGWVVIFPTWLAFLALHDVSPWLLLSFALIVWVADIAAYFVGKSIGRHKLAPAISPGKTIEGAAGAVVGVTAYYFLWKHLLASTTVGREAWAQELALHGWFLFALFVLLGFMSVLGDLFESWMKRGVGMKDSSRLLPGHGGILDRIDALTSTLPLAGLYIVLATRM